MASTPEGYRWVSCSVEMDWSTAQHRHLIPKGHDTTVCGSTGFGDVWRGNSKKPECDKCIAKYEARYGALS